MQSKTATVERFGPAVPLTRAQTDTTVLTQVVKFVEDAAVLRQLPWRVKLEGWLADEAIPFGGQRSVSAYLPAFHLKLMGVT
jgi:hypothetical protein